MVPEPDTRVDELRAQLRSLGYLDAGVDRFVLGAARDTRGPIGVAARTAARVGLLGGALLGPAAAIGVGARLPGLVSGVRDAIVLAVYLAIFFVAAVAITSFLVSLAASAFARARGASRAAAWIFTSGSLLYLTLWWRNANAGFGWSAPILTAFALFVAVAISLLLGHAVRIATLAVLAARHAGAALPPVASRSWRVVAAGGVLAFAGAAALLILAAPSDVPAATPSLTVVSTGTRVRVIAIDGFDLKAYLDHADASTRFSQTMHTASLLAVHDTGDPARAWTTIATGAPPDAHGVHGIETRRVAGVRGILSLRGGRMANLLGAAADVVRLTRPALTSRDERRVKTVWEVAEDAGLRTAVVNWWATWPAQGKGIVISDRAMVRLEKGGALDAEIAPASVYEPLRAQWGEIRRRAQQLAASAFAAVPDAAAQGALRRSAELDATVVEILHALPGPARDLDVIYLPGLDIAQHALLARDASGAEAASELAARVAAIGLYYEFLERLVEPLLAVDPDDAAIVLTQPGRVATPLEGHVVILGVPAAPQAASMGTPLDVEPTIAYALGLPLSQELSGHPMERLFAPEFVGRNRQRAVPTYGRPFATSEPRHGTPLDQEAIDRLRSLGYVK